jgi:hypothetical protein
VVNGTDHNYPYNKMSFERKLRMMRVELFSTLLITDSTSFIKKESESKLIKTGIVEYSSKDKVNALEATGLPTIIIDWQDILYDKCLQNKLTDVQCENASNDDFLNFADPEYVNRKNVFIYANYLTPGMHKFVIYCPLSKRAFCKTILVDVNTKE